MNTVVQRKPSLKLNLLLSGIKALTTVIFPLITFKYASTILTVSNLGKVNYASSINSIIALIASLGISTYAVREFSSLRDDKQQLETAASQVFSINVYSTIVAYIVYFLVLLLVPGLSSYWKLCAIFSLQLILTTLGTEWINTIYEDYIYIAIRSILIQIICLLLTIIFIHSKDDLFIYAFISMLTVGGPNLINFFYCRRKHCKVHLTRNLNLKRHIKPIIFLFSTNVATVIFVNSDTALLGYIAGDYYTGLYSVATKVYLSVKQILLMCVTVTIPRISYLIGNNQNEKVNKLFQTIQNGVFIISIPAAMGLILLSKDVILLLSDETYLPAQTAFCILAITLVVCSLSYFYSSCIMIPFKLEKQLLITTSIGAILNIFLNIILIPFLFHTATAITTFISEATVLILDICITRKYVKVKFDLINFLQICVATICIVIFNHFISNLFGFYSHLVISVIGSIFIYVVVLVLLHNKYAMLAIRETMSKIRGKK